MSECGPWWRRLVVVRSFSRFEKVLGEGKTYEAFEAVGTEFHGSMLQMLHYGRGYRDFCSEDERVRQSRARSGRLDGGAS